MPKLLVSISSCESFETAGLNQPMRDTWLPDAVKLGIDYKFFHGSGSTPKSDVIVLPVDDGMGGLTEKAKAKAKWAFENGYDFVFSCFPDTYACAERLLTCGFEEFDYFGDVYQHPGGAPYCQGGAGYFLSRKACETLFRDPTSYLNDDCWIGDVLKREDIRRGDSREFKYVGPGPLKTNTVVSNHLSTQPGGYTVDKMPAEHKRWLDSNGY
jgi:hypothetical protein